MGRVVVYALLVYLTSGLFLYFRQGHLLFPAPDPAGTPVFHSHLPIQDLQIPVATTDHLHAWWIPAARPSDKALLCLHGNGYGLDEMTEEAGLLHTLGVNLLLVDYRGYGSSTKLVPNEATVVQDARAALAYLLLKRKLRASDTFILGRSVGSGPATRLAAETRGLGGLILESAFTSIDEVARSFWYARAFPVSLLLHTHFDNLAEIGSIQAPLLIIAGASDSLTPVWMSEKLFARAQGPKRIYIIKGAGHDDLLDVGGNALIERLRQFVNPEP